MTVKITYFVHGTTVDNEKKLASGHADAVLSEIGVKQAKELKKQIAETFDVVFTSDLKRSIDTAKLAFESGKTVQDKRLRECDYGEFTQKHKEWVISDYVSIPYPGGESYKDVEKRIASFLEFLRKNHDGKHVAIVAHQAPQLALEVLTKGKTWQQAIAEDWRKTKSWQPGWKYIID
tara:strand:- start:69 stop:599 length:531 start_codon:yes stop_codon:yes gene_type:complete